VADKLSLPEMLSLFVPWIKFKIRVAGDTAVSLPSNTNFGPDSGSLH